MAQAELSHYDEAEADFAKSLELEPQSAGAVGSSPSTHRGAGKEKDRASCLCESECGEAQGKEAA